MKRQLAALFLFSLILGSTQLPANAQFNVAFGRHDYNRDGRWDRREFNNANAYYYQRHPHVQVLDNDGDFDRLDRNRDGYLGREEVRTYRTW
jgi:hypothetical protein